MHRIQTASDYRAPAPLTLDMPIRDQANGSAVSNDNVFVEMTPGGGTGMATAYTSDSGQCQPESLSRLVRTSGIRSHDHSPDLRRTLWRPIMFALILLTAVSSSLLAAMPEGEAATTMIRLPFRTGTSWMISQGYNTSPVNGGTHWNCDPGTLRDRISQTAPCRAGWQYQYSLDFRRPSGSSAGEPVISPVDGTIRWIDESTGGMSINLGNGYAVAFFHATLAPGLAEGQPVSMGQQLGAVAPPGAAANGGSPHIHLTVWQTDDGGNWSRNPRPFTGNLALDGYDLPAQDASKINQYHTTILVSSNTPLPTGSSGIPVAPTLRQPASGAEATSPVEFSWNAVDGATEYQVVVDSRTFSAWTGNTSNSMTLSQGSHTWQVRARNDAGTGTLSGQRTITVRAADAATGPSVTVSDTVGEVGEIFTVGGSGFTPGQSAAITWRSTTLRTLTVPASGSFTTQITIPRTPNGTWPIEVSTSGEQASTDFRVIPSLERDPARGAPGTSVTITVNGFDPNETVQLNWRSASGPELARVTTNANGTGRVTISLPDASTGWNDYTGYGLSSNLRAWGAIQIQPDVMVNPSTAGEGDRIAVTGRGFPANSNATVRIGDRPSTSGTQLCTLSTDSMGRGGCMVTVPDLPTGGYALVLKASNGTEDSATLTIEGPPSVSALPESAAAGTEIIVRIGGFGANEPVTVRWGEGAVWRTVTTDPNGNATASGTVSNLPPGDASVTARNGPGAMNASTTFRVAATASPGATTMTGPGTYKVVATREGLVGYTTSNGHVIVPDDHFVSLPACTTTSCPWMDPGERDPSWGVSTQCGDNCYVMAINETTGACEVAPVWDVGPWFTVDDWWNPGPDRYLNQLPSNPNYLAQGVTGAGAARNGLDVGYGIGPNGIGSSNRYTTVGNASVIDLADGTWTAIGLEFNKGIDVIDVELLWQTGQSPASAAAECGHPLDQSGDTGDLSLSVTQGTAGTRVQVSGGDFSNGESVRIYVGSTSSPAVATARASSSGAISTTIIIPDRERGNADIIAVGASSATQQESVFSITPSIDRSPTSGAPGTRVAITVHGYGANEEVRLWWDNASGTVIATIRTNGNGTGSTTFTVPNNRGAGWNTYFARGVTSNASAYGAFNITGGGTTPSPTPTATATPSLTQTPSPGPVDDLVASLVAVLIQILEEILNPAPTPTATVTASPGSNPSFSGEPLPVASVSASALPSGQQTNAPNRAIDGDAGTSWQTTGGDPQRATITLDLGQAQSVSGVKWVYSRPDGIDRQILQVSADGATWDQLVITSARQPLQWEGQAVNRDIRYVRLILTNDADLPVLGYIAEIRVWGESPVSTLSALASTPAPSGETSVAYVANTNGGNLNCRSGAGTTGDVIGKLAPGDAVTIIGPAQGGWLPVECGEESGWVSADYVSESTQAESIPIAATPVSVSVEEGVETEPVLDGEVEATPSATEAPTEAATPMVTEVSIEPVAPTPAEISTGTPTPIPTVVPTETPTPAPTEAPAEVPTPTPTETSAEVSTPEPVLQTTEIVVPASTDLSVNAADPGATEDPANGGALFLGGPDGEITGMTFDISEVGGGEISNATLVVQGTGDASGSGGPVYVASGVRVDDYGSTWNSLQGQMGSSAGYLDWIGPGAQSTVDLTGWIPAEGPVTVILPGTPDQRVMIASLESGAPAYLVLTIEEWITPES